MKYTVKKIVNYDCVDDLLKAEGGKHVEEIIIVPFDKGYSISGGLTKKQTEIYDFLLSKKEKAPSLDEIRQYIGVGSINTIVCHLDALEKKGYVRKSKHRKRYYELLK